MAHKTMEAEREVEVTYLPKQLPQGIGQVAAKRIVDIYLSDSTDLLVKLRLRQKGDTYEMTKKVSLDPNDLSLQDEYNIPLTKGEFAKLRLAGGREVVKDRYLVVFGKNTLEVDVFRGELEGLVLIEVEFGSKVERDAFTPPDYFGADVTQEDFIAGAYLAGKSYANIQPELDRFNYLALHLG